MSQKIITKLFAYANKIGADHLTITSLPPEIRFDYQLPHGQAWSLCLPLKLAPDFLETLNRMLNWKKDEQPLNQRGQLKCGRQKINFYLSVRTLEQGQQIILNLMSDPVRVWRLSQIGLTYAQQKELKKNLKSKSGLIIIGAADRQGKSATLSALLLEINDPQKNIYWLSQSGYAPNYELPGINYCSLTKNIWDKLMSHDSDLIVVDDLSTAADLSAALRAAQSGRLVIATLLADNPADLRQTLEQITATQKSKQRLIKMVLWQKLAPWPQRNSGLAKVAGSSSKRTLIGRFSELKL